ncbi:Uncharacterised protein [Escherichia coli]|uniref:Uncharacterized protein n=1 Tax=Escherichia coli TaxID=562 RepID=A0A377CXK7_ECOLX|nr:Uncharacterised protein [Escherichia coli]
MRGRGVESVAKCRSRQDGGTECNATKRQQFAAISVEFVHDNQVYRSMFIVYMHFWRTRGTLTGQ